MTNFAGRWLTTFGPMQLQQDGKKIHGSYFDGDAENHIEGELKGTRFVFEYTEAAASGAGWFELLRPGKFQGEWKAKGDITYRAWVGERAFEGIWETSFGPMRLVHEADRVVGFYEGAGSSSLSGTINNDKLEFRYTEPKAEGEGWFELSEDWQTFRGLWRPLNATGWGEWVGKRVQPRPNYRWLIVIEAHWQRWLTEAEYSFGGMLREFFARLGHVGVRHRYFNDAPSLERWCREVLYIPEPTIVMFATHGNDDGLVAHGNQVNPDKILDVFPYADNIQLLHFSACLMMKDGKSSELPRKLNQVCRFPISGYTTSVDWGGSALIEFSYLDMILAKGLAPADAAQQLVKQLAFAGSKPHPGSPYPPAGFRIFLPPGEKRPRKAR